MGNRMYKMFAALEGLFGICCIIAAFWLAYKGAPSWLILLGLVVSIIACSYAISALRPKNKKLKVALTVITGVCFIIMGLLQGVWGGQNTTVMALYILVGIIGLVAATLAYFNIGYRHYGTYK